MWEKIEKLMVSKGVKIADIHKATGISYSSFTDWRKGVCNPKQDKLQKIADFFGVPLDYFSDVQTDAQPKAYYFDEETAEIAEDIFQRPDLRLLFKNSRKMTPEDLKTLMTLAEALQKKT